MQHDLVGRLRGIDGVAFAPVVADGVGEDTTGAVEGGGWDGSADLRVPLESMLGVLVPEMESAVGAGCAERAVHRVEGDGVDAVHVRYVTCRRRRLPVTFEGKVGAIVLQRAVRMLDGYAGAGKGLDYLLSFSSTYWIAQRPSMLPTAKPEPSLKQLTTRVCHFNGLCMVL